MLPNERINFVWYIYLWYVNDVGQRGRTVEESYMSEEKGFEYEGIWITDPTVSECGRFEVDPITYYGLTQEQVEELL